MTDIRVKGLNIHLVGTVIGEVVHIVVKQNLMIDTDNIQGIFGINQITLINHITLMKMIGTVEEISISIGMKQPTIKNKNGKTIGQTHLDLEIQEMVKATLVKVTLYVINLIQSST